MQFKTININDIQPAEYNPRRMKPSERLKLKQGLEAYGLIDPIIIDIKHYNTIISGHQRYSVLKDDLKVKELKMLTFNDIGLIFNETSFNIKDINDQKAMNISLNKITGEFDDDQLEQVINDLLDDNYNIELTGFSKDELLDDYNIPLEPLNQETETKEAHKENINETITYFNNEQIKEEIIKEYNIPEKLEDYIKQIINPAVAMYQFNRLCQGYNDGYNISLLFNPHRLTTKTIGKKISLFEAMKTDMYKKDFARYITEYCKVLPNTQLYKYIGIGHAGYQYVNEFPPYIARDIYKKYTKEGDKILNPCAGWGGRLIGLASLRYTNIEYIETDPNTQTVKGLKEIKKFLNLDENMYKTYDQPIELLKLEKNYFDFIFTSPPYFNTELYDGEESSYKNKNNYHEWETLWLQPFIDQLLSTIKGTGTILLNVGKNRYPIDESIKTYLNEKHQITVESISDYKIGGSGIGKRTGGGGEPFLKFKK